MSSDDSAGEKGKYIHYIKSVIKQASVVPSTVLCMYLKVC